jgi:hypothetical protein
MRGRAPAQELHRHQRLESHPVMALKGLSLFLIFFHQRLEMRGSAGSGERWAGLSRGVLKREQRGACIPLVVTKLAHD